VSIAREPAGAEEIDARAWIVTKQMQVLVVGGANLERASDGSWVTKSPIADYLHEIADRFGGCVWMARASGTWAVEIEEATAKIGGHLDAEKIRAIPFDASISSAPKNWLLLLRQLIRRPYAVFFLPAILPMTPVLPLARLLTRNLAVYLGGDYTGTAATLGKTKWLGWAPLFRFGFESSIRLANFVIAPGQHLATLARKCNPNVIETVPLGRIRGAEISGRRELRDEEPRRILYLGLLLASKGMRELLRALRLLVDRRPGPEVALDVLGDGPDRPAFEALCRELDLERRVCFHGWVDGEESIARFFSRADVLVIPSSTYQEGVPRAIDEALVRGIPVVATRIGGIPGEFRSEEVLLVDPGLPAPLAAAIEAVLFDPQTRKRQIDGAERRRLHWQRFGSAAEQHAKLLLGEIPISRG
jgi:glycosyltransferase involved in cell wall biosynthesis